MTTTTKTKPPTPPLSKRSRTFSSSRTAAAALGLPPEVFRLARVRGGDAAFDASNRVKERPFVEWLLTHLIDRFEVALPTDDIPTSDGDLRPENLVDLFDAPQPSVQMTLAGSAADYQASRILWGDAWAVRIAKEATALLKAYTKDCEAIQTKVDAVAAKHTLPLSLGRFYPPELNLSRPPFETLGLSGFGLWVESEKEFPRGPRYWHSIDEPWTEPIDLESKSMWLHSRMVPACIVPDAEYRKIKRDIMGKIPYHLRNQ